ncbi:MAG: hypothetical protein ACKOX3_09945 [Bacteroidota bacterium]
MQSKRYLSSFLIILIYYFVAGLIVMILWNWLLPEIFGLKSINYWEACGLILLTNFLFNRTFTRKYILRKNCEKEKWAHLCDEKKDRLNEMWEKRCNEISKSK